MSTLVLAKNGIAYLPIVINEFADEVVINATKELKHYLNRITGAEFEIRNKFDGPAIRLDIDEILEEEEYVVKCCVSNGLRITGSTSRGIFYGVYGLLEDVFGVRFFAPDVTSVPIIETLELTDMILNDKPAMEYRQVDYPPCVNHPEWCARNRINGFHNKKLAKEMAPYGGVKEYALFVHTFKQLVNPDIYFEEHPEYFSMVEGKRVKEDTQLCLTNPEVLAIATENVKKYLRDNPNATLISVSQNDSFPNHNYCECPECSKIDAENESHAGSLLYFVNAVAEAIEEEFPHVVVDTLAYKYTRKPPTKIKPRHNVCVRLCDIECCFAHPLESCNQICLASALKRKSKTSFQEDLVAWGKLCNRLYIWDYVTNFQHFWLPFPNIHVLAPNMQFFKKNNVKGMYPESNWLSSSPDLMELRIWLLSKLMWNPDFDVKKGIYEFTETVYGAAAEDVREYIQLLQNRVIGGDIHVGILAEPDSEYLDPGTLARMQELIANARMKELNFVQRIYVEKWALSVEYSVVSHNILNGNVDMVRIDAIMEKAHTLGIDHISERKSTNLAYRQMMDGII